MREPSLALGWDGLAALTVFASLSELSQAFVPWRTYEWMDLTANLMGVLVGFSAASFPHKGRRS